MDFLKSIYFASLNKPCLPISLYALSFFAENWIFVYYEVVPLAIRFFSFPSVFCLFVCLIVEGNSSPFLYWLSPTMFAKIVLLFMCGHLNLFYLASVQLVLSLFYIVIFLQRLTWTLGTKIKNKNKNSPPFFVAILY